MTNLTLSSRMALACMQPVANQMLYLPCTFAEIAECPASKAITTVANGLKTLIIQELRDFEQGLIKLRLSDYVTGYTLLRCHCHEDRFKAGSSIIHG